MSVVEFAVRGEARGKARPRFANGRTYTDTPTLRAEQHVREAWHEAGCDPLEGPLALHVTLVQARPKGHFRTNGELNAAGERAPIPVRKPDVDNALKLVMDALNGLAYGDDVQIVVASIARTWAVNGDGACTRIKIEEVRV